MSPSDLPPEFRHAEPYGNAAELPAKRRPSWWVAAPAGLLILLGIIWSGVWYYAAGRAQSEIDNWIAAEAGQGRKWSCADRQIGGYPFRFELMCASPSLTLDGPMPVTWTARGAHAVAQVWNPRHIIAEFQGPATVTEAGTDLNLEANWTLMQVSGTGSAKQLERSALSANDYVLKQGTTTLFSAKHLELHMRQHPGAQAPGTLDIAMGVSGATGALLGTSNGAALPPVDSELQVTVSGMPEFRTMSVEERLAQWQANGGRIKIDQARLSAGGGVITATGEVGLDAQRRPDGMVTLAVANADKLIPALTAAGMMPPFLANLAPLISAAGMPTQIDGQNASSFPFMFSNGRVALGILPIGKIGPLF